MRVLAAVILVTLTLGGCGGVPARGVAASTSTAVIPPPALTSSALRTPVPRPTASPAVTPNPRISRPAGDPHEGVVTYVYRYLVPLEKLISGSEPASPRGRSPYGFALAAYTQPDEWGDVDIITMLNDGTRVAKEQSGRLVSATPYDLARGQKVAFWGSVAESYPGQGLAEFVLNKDEKAVDLTPPQRPDTIYSLRPDEAGETCPQDAISVEILLSDAMRDDGFADMSKIELQLDGRDITDRLTVLGTADSPQSLLHLHYQKRLDLGRHRVALTYRNEDGDVRTYRWRFMAERTLELGGARFEC